MLIPCFSQLQAVEEETRTASLLFQAAAQSFSSIKVSKLLTYKSLYFTIGNAGYCYLIVCYMAKNSGFVSTFLLNR